MRDRMSGMKLLQRWQSIGMLLGGSLLLISMLAACGPSASTAKTGTGTQPKAGGSVVDIFDEDVDSFLPWNTSETFGLDGAASRSGRGCGTPTRTSTSPWMAASPRSFPPSTNGDVSI